MFNRINDGMYWDRAWKLVEGCTPVSEGCAHCWSARETRMRANNPNGKISTRNRMLTTKVGAFNGKVRVRKDNLDLPLLTKKPTVWAIWNDLFHEGVSWEFIDWVFFAMSKAPHHVFLLLTKRPERMLEYMTGQGGPNTPGLKPLTNVWLGVTAENQEQADKRIPILLQVPAARRYVSIEPMLGPVDLRISAFNGADSFSSMEGLHWVICGGESGPGARPMHPDWARSLRDQCKTAGVPYFFKQWGEWAPGDNPGVKAPMKRWKEIPHGATEARRVSLYGDEAAVGHTLVARIGKKAAGRILDSREWLEVPKI